MVGEGDRCGLSRSNVRNIRVDFFSSGSRRVILPLIFTYQHFRDSRHQGFGNLGMGTPPRKIRLNFPLEGGRRVPKGAQGTLFGTSAKEIAEFTAFAEGQGTDPQDPIQTR